MAFADGDIAFFLANTIPIRKSKKPYTGCKILDTAAVGLTLAFLAEVKPYKFPQLFQFLGEFEYRMRTDKELFDW